MKNRNRSERYIIECYIYEESIEFCSEYLINVEAIGFSKFHFIKRKYDTKLGNQWLLSVKTYCVKHIDVYLE